MELGLCGTLGSRTDDMQTGLEWFENDDANSGKCRKVKRGAKGVVQELVTESLIAIH